MTTSIRASLRARNLYVVRDAEHALELCEKHGARDFLFATSCRKGAASPWHALLAQVTRRAPVETVTGWPCIVDLEAGSSEDVKSVVRQLGRALLECGAASVTVWGRPVVLARAA
jgi:hypothetical protein